MHFFISKKSYSGLILLVLFCLSHNIEAQDQTIQSSYDQAIASENLALADSIIGKIIINCSEQWDTAFDKANFLIDHYQRFQFDWDFAKRLNYLRKLESCIYNHSPRDFEVIARLQYHYAVYFRQDLQEDSMQHHLNEMRDNIELHGSPTRLAISLEYEQARLAYIQNDQASLLTYLESALSYLDDHFPEEVRLRLNILNGIGIGLRRTFQPKKAIEHHHNTLAYLNEVDPGSNWVGTVLNNVGLCFQDLLEYDSAIYYMNKAIHHYRFLGPEYIDQIGSGLYNVSSCFRYAGKLDSALVYGLNSLETLQAHHGSSHADLLLPYISLTLTCIRKGDLEKATDFYTQGLKLLKVLGWSRDDPSVNAYMQDVFPMIGSGIFLARTQYLNSGDQEFLNLALSRGEDFMHTMDYAYDYLKNSISKDIFQGQHKNYINTIIENQFLAFDVFKEDSIISRTFEYFEKFKALDLLYAAQRDKIDKLNLYQQLSNHQTELVARVNNLQAEISKVGADTDTLNILTQELHDAQESIYQWQDEIRKNHPNYHDLLYHPRVATLSDVKRKLSEDQSVLTYFVSDTTIYSITINADGQYLNKSVIPSQITLDSLILGLRNALLDLHLTPRSSDEEIRLRGKNLSELSYQLYGLLIEPVSPHLKSKVLISPHKSIGYLPFDLLLKEMPKDPLHFRSHAYFIKERALHFSPSITLWIEMNDKERMDGQKILAIAPSYKKLSTPIETIYALRSSLQPLVYNEQEVDQIIHHFEGVALKGPDATKEAFLSKVADFSMIHFAMHGKANDDANEASFLAFSNENDHDFKLFIPEVYNLSLNTNMVSISACESGYGQLRNAEGVISLARAFSFAGAKSILSTLWSINDRSTSSLMDHYYRGLKDGLRKEVALQEAKLKYIDQADHTAADPFYWSSFMLIGDTSPIASGTSPFFILLPIGLAAFLLLLYVRYRPQNKVG